MVGTAIRLAADMHDPCAPRNNSVRQGDDWLAHYVPVIMRSAAYRSGGAIIITWDEGEGNDGPIGLIALSPDIRRGMRVGEHLTHSATLRTIEEVFGLRPLLGNAARSRDLSAMFRRFP